MSLNLKSNIIAIILFAVCQGIHEDNKKSEFELNG